MTTPSHPKPSVPIRVTHSVKIHPPESDAGAGLAEQPYDLSGSAYRVILGCCTQEESTKNISRRRQMPAQTTTPIRKKEVIS